jgi:hypothetical protein
MFVNVKHKVSESECCLQEPNRQESRGFYLHAINKDGVDMCATEKVARSCVSSS